MRLASALAAALALACSRTGGPVHVVSVRAAAGAVAGPLREAGLDDGALERAARAALERAGFRMGEGARAHRALVDVASVRLAPPAAAGGAVRVEVSVEIELTPVEPAGAPSSREVGTFAVPLQGGDPGAAWTSALAGAANDAAEGLALGFAAAAKSTEAIVQDLGSKDARVRDHAIRVVADRRSAAAVPALLERLKDEDPRLVHRAVGALAQIGDARAVPPLIDLSRSGDAALASRVTRVIGDIGGDEAEGYLLTVASGHPDARVRKAAREALADMSAKAERARATARK